MTGRFTFVKSLILGFALVSVFATQVASGTAADSTREHLYVNSREGIEVFPLRSTGNVRPERSLLLPFYAPQLAFAPNDDLVVAGGIAYPSYPPPEIAVYAPHASGNAIPLRVISGSNTTLLYPEGVAVDAAGEIYISDPVAGQVDVFAPDASGNVAPIRVIAGPATLLNNGARQLALDDAGDVFVQQTGYGQSGGQILEFAPNASGNVAPLLELSSPKGPFAGIAIRDGKIYVAGNEDAYYGGGIMRIYSQHTLEPLEHIRNRVWRKVFFELDASDRAPNGTLYVLTSSPRYSGVWEFPPSASSPGGVAPDPNGFLGGSRTRFDGGASYVAVGP